MERTSTEEVTFTCDLDETAEMLSHENWLQHEQRQLTIQSTKPISTSSPSLLVEHEECHRACWLSFTVPLFRGSVIHTGDLSDAWVVKVIETEMNGVDRNEKYPTVFSSKGLRANYVNKGQAAKGFDVKGVVKYKLVFGQYHMFGAEGSDLDMTLRAVGAFLNPHGKSTIDLGLVAQNVSKTDIMQFTKGLKGKFAYSPTDKYSQCSGSYDNDRLGSPLK